MIAAKSKRFVLIAAFIGAVLAGSVTPSFAFLDKTRFVAHLGIAYFCFHHWVLKPYQQGAFAGGAPHRISTIIKGSELPTRLQRPAPIRSYRNSTAV